MMVKDLKVIFVYAIVHVQVRKSFLDTVYVFVLLQRRISCEMKT